MEINHADMVKSLRKDGQTIVIQLTPQDADAWHMASCVCGEAGELFDCIKKRVIYRKELDRANLLEELGDIEFYLEGIRQVYGVTRKETLDANIAKLAERYDNFKYSDKAAQERKDKL